MTAVASPPSYPAGLSPRNGWPTSGNNGNGNVDGSVSGSAINLNAMSQDDVSRMFVPRKSAQRSNSSSSLSSNASTASTSTTISSSATTPSTNGELPTRRKPTKGLWPSSAKSEPVPVLVTARATSGSTGTPGPSAASAISALHTPQNSNPQMAQSNGAPRGSIQGESPTILNLTPLNGTFERKSITVPYTPDVLRIGRQTNAKTVPTPMNGYFDSKVLSRQHAEVWSERDGKIFIRDVKSSNGTFVNGKRLSQENRDSEPHPLKEGDILELGIDIISEDQKTVVHHKVAAKVEHAGLMGIVAPPQELMDAENFHAMRARAGTNANRSQQNLSAAAYHAKWLQPITLEHIAKRLKTELRQAKLQHQDLLSTSQFVEAVASNENPSAPPQPKIASPTKSADLKARFSTEPPAPPPSQPLPEKPDAVSKIRFHDLPAIQPLLRRSDTERPRVLNGSPISPEAAPSISSLFNALSLAKDEINAQTERMRLLEESLQQEREARQYAEARVKLASSDATPIGEAVAIAQHDEAGTSSPSSRIELMRLEVEQMRMQMETYRQRAEKAESQNETLAEMIEKIKREDETKKQRGSWSLRKTRKARVATETETSKGAEEVDNKDTPTCADGLEEEVNQIFKNHLTRQQTLRADDADDSPSLSDIDSDEQIRSVSADVARALRTRGLAGGLLSQRQRHDRLAQTVPLASIVGVVLIGVGIMTYLNGWQKAVAAER